MPITVDSDLEQLQCPMTLEIMDDPVIAEDGYTYERSAITRWINENGTSPMTRMRMQASELRPNRAIKALIDTYHTQTQRIAVNVMLICYIVFVRFLTFYRLKSHRILRSLYLLNKKILQLYKTFYTKVR